MILWLAFQLIAVTLSAGRVALWAKYPTTGETLALRAVLATQLITSALLLPVLLQSIHSTAATIVTAWPFAVVAATLSSTPPHGVLWAESFVSLWLITLFVWQTILRSAYARIAMQAVVICIVFSGPLYGYLMTDFSAGSTVRGADWLVQATPLIFCFSLLTANRPTNAAIVLLSLLLFPPLVTAFARRGTQALQPSAD